MEMGTPNYGAMLPLEQHSALWVQDGVACLRLQKRKHRARRSCLQRTCSCRAHGHQTCVVCRIALHLRDHPKVSDGDRLTAMSPTRLMALIRAALAVAGVQRAPEATLKMFRAGHATTMAAAMAAAGESLGAILLAGDWTSAAFLRYCMENEIDHCRFMSATIDGSGDEADEFAPIIRPDYISGQNEVCDFNDI